jgi:phytoene dehydrogenase-like protein
MSKRFTDLGGILCCNRKVEQVVIEDERAVGIVVGGKVIPADAVLVAADTLSAIDTLFSPPLSEPWMNQMRKKTNPLVTTFVSLGIEADLSSLPRTIAFPLDTPLKQGDCVSTQLNLHNYSACSGYSAPGCSAVAIILDADYDYWKTAREEGESVYQQRKKELYEALLARLESQFPVIKGKVVVWDIATPLTFERYCGTYHGSWLTKNIPGHKMLPYPRRAKSIKRLYFAGQRILPPGGLPVAVTTGRTAVQYLCRDFGAVFG